MYSMSKLSQNQINHYLDKLFTIVEGLSIQDIGKEYLKYNLFVDFIDLWQFDEEKNAYTLDEYLVNPQSPSFEDVSATIGIQNTSQLNRYMNEFKECIRKANNKKLEPFLIEFENLQHVDKDEKTTLKHTDIDRIQLFTKHGIKEIKEIDWNAQLKKIFGTEISFAGEQASILTSASILTQYQNTNKDELLIVDKLENKLAIEAADYNHHMNENWQTHKFDPLYFDNFIAGRLLDDFKQSIYAHIKPLNNQEINKYLSLSLQQFKTHTPPKRHRVFLRIYYHTYWYPNHMEYKHEDYMTRFATHVWKHYTNHFELYKKTVEAIYHEFKMGLVGYEDTPKVKPSKKANTRSFLYKNLSIGAENLTDLLKSLKKHHFVAEDTPLPNFRAVFSEKEISETILWTGNLSELAHFIKTLHNTAKKVEDTKQKQWEITINCFQMADGTVLSKDKLRAQKEPARAAIIEKAVQIL